MKVVSVLMFLVFCAQANERKTDKQAKKVSDNILQRACDQTITKIVLCSVESFINNRTKNVTAGLTVSVKLQFDSTGIIKKNL